MWLRRSFFHWLLPAAFLLPLWLVVGWIVFDANGWALALVLFIAAPAVFVAQLVTTLLVRARSTVRDERAVSWSDVAGIGVWHALTIAVGFYPAELSWMLVVLAIGAFLVVFWSSLSQLFRGARPVAVVRHTADGARYVSPARPEPAATEPDVYVISETPPDSER
ncbi:MFS transporter permease [Microbacterium sp.]|uniref:MFS transporter permease n=1 Tax=Microbacterium sp. TaxID=51671 RepID=UPI003A86CE2A